MANEDLPFIFEGPEIPKDHSVRTLIRQQAMRRAGIARRKFPECTDLPRSSIVKPDEIRRETNLNEAPDGSSAHIQVPTSSEATVTSKFASSPPCLDTWNAACVTSSGLEIDAIPQGRVSYPGFELLERSSPPGSPPANLSPDRDYERARIRFGINITDFGALTNFTVHKASIGKLLAESSLLFDSCRLKPRSYLDYIPSRYGLSPAITAATDCLLAKIRLQLYPSATSYDSELCTQLYCHALQTLQDALKDETKCLDADVLCATQLLSLHELLRPRDDSAWTHHVNGTARLMQLRSPARFTSELEKALFVSHVGSIATEAMLSSQHCYLAAPEWCAVYRSVAQESDFLAERSPLTIKIRIGQVQLTSIWQDVHDVVNSADLFDAVVVAAVETRCRQLHESFLDIMDEYEIQFADLYPANPPLNELALRRELLGTLIECIAIVKRLLSTLCDTERPTLETETQVLARELLDLQRNPPPKHFLLFTGHEVRVARSLIHTREQWEGAIGEGIERHFDSETQRLAVRLRYNMWNTMLR